MPFALNVLTFRGREISNVTAFIARSAQEADNDRYQRWPELAPDEKVLQGTFGSFGLPDRLEGPPPAPLER
jgi:hypothetical protein